MAAKRSARRSKYAAIASILPASRMAFFMEHYVEFVEAYIMGKNHVSRGGTQFVSEQQKEILTSVMNNRKTTVAAGRGVGKTAVLSWLIIIFMTLYSDPKVFALAPSYSQLMSVLWPEVAKWLDQSLLKPYMEHTAKRLYMKDNPKKAFAEPRTASKKESVMGFHAKNMLIMMDESPGIEDEIYDVVSGSMTEYNNKIILMGNPTRTSGFFYDSHNGKARHTWNRIQLDSEKSELVSKEFIDDMRNRYGELHTIYKVHVKGQFPDGDPDAFISLGDVEMAASRDINHAGMDVEIGVDVARMGDDLTCIAVREGYHVFPLRVKGKTKVNEVVQMVYDTVDWVREELGYDKTIRVKVDDSGVGGGVSDYLELDTEHNIDIVPCNFGGAGNLVYENEATTMWADFRDVIHRVSLPYDDRILIEEIASRRWQMTKRGRQMIESKKTYKKDFKKSPDRADAIMLCFARKKAVSRVFSSFDRINKNLMNDEQYRDFGAKFIGIKYDNKNMANVSVVQWQNGLICIIDEFSGDTVSAMEVVRNHATKKVIGSKNMFSGGEDLYIQYMREGVYVRENYGYNEHGAVMYMSKLIDEGLFKLLPKCSESLKQISTWTYDKSSGTLNDRGLVGAMLIALSELKDTPEIDLRIDKSFSNYASNAAENSNINLGYMSV